MLVGSVSRTAAVAAAALAAATFAIAPLGAQQVEKPRLRWEYFHDQRAFPFDEIPTGAFRAAVREYRARWPAMLLPLAQQQADTAWTPLGPGNIPGLSIQSSGRLTAIAVHPRDPNVIYVGGAQGGVWKTTNGGASWTPLTDRECSLAMGWIVLDPVDPDIVYAATGEQHFSGDSYYGCGVLRSTDGGTTWTQLGASVFDLNTATAGGVTISRIVLDPRTAGSAAGATLHVAAENGVWKSTDGGVSWTRTLAAGGNGPAPATDLVMHPSNPDVLYAALGRVAGDTANGVYRSTDAGATWTKLGGGFPSRDVGRINLAIAPSQPSILYASVQNDFNDAGGANGSLLGIYKSTDGGESWALASNAPSCNTQCWYDMALAVHPRSPDTVFFGGVPLFRSTDGGQTFQNVGTGPGGSVHVDQHVVVYDPNDPRTVYVGNDGGIYRSRAGGAPGTWESLNSDIAITQFYPGIGLHPTDPASALGGTQDNGTLRYAGSPSWQHVLGGDGGFTAIDFNDPATAYAETQWVPNSGFSGPRRSDNGGPFELKVSGIAISDRARFIPPLVMDPSDPNVLYFGTYRVYRTADRGESWTLISPDLAGPGRTITAIAPAPSAPRVIYVGTNGGEIHRTRDGGGEWVNVSSGIPRRVITDIAVDPGNPDIAFATVSGFQTEHVFRTMDGGETWTAISDGLPDLPVNAIVTDPRSSAILYIGTDLGVFRTVDGGASWEPLNVGLPNVAVFDLALNPRTGRLVAATHGRGMFQREVAVDVVAVTGTVRYYAGAQEPVAGVTLTGTGALEGAQSTGPSGAYTLLGTLGGAGTVTPAKTGDRRGALSALDAAFILGCAAGSRTCAGEQALAADVTGDGVVTQEDARVLLDVLVGARAGPPAGDWRFEPAARTYAVLTGNQEAQDFTAVLVGDVSGNWSAAAALFAAGPGGTATAVRASRGARGTIALRAAQTETAADGTILLEARLPGGTVLGLEAEIAFDAAVEVLDVRPAASATGFLLAHRSEPGRLRVALASATGVAEGGVFARIVIRTAAGGQGARVVAARINEEEAGGGPLVVDVTEPPASFELRQNVPNPFGAATGTRLVVEVPEVGDEVSRLVRVDVYNVRGALVRRLLDQALEPGRYPVAWDGRDDSGALVPSGVYIAVAEFAGSRRRIRMLFVR